MQKIPTAEHSPAPPLAPGPQTKILPLKKISHHPPPTFIRNISAPYRPLRVAPFLPTLKSNILNRKKF
jgi:hypothetical protein